MIKQKSRRELDQERRMQGSLHPHDVLSRQVYRVLEHYICPSTCNAKCCNHYDGDIVIEIGEYNSIITSVSNRKADVIRQIAKQKNNGSYVINGNCALLEGNKCGIYDARPKACRRFPFAMNLSPNSSKISYDLYITACPLSITILVDFIDFLRSNNITSDVLYMCEEAKQLFQQEISNEVISGLSFLIDKRLIDHFTDYLDNKCMVRVNEARKEKVRNAVIEQTTKGGIRPGLLKRRKGFEDMIDRFAESSKVIEVRDW